MKINNIPERMHGRHDNSNLDPVYTGVDKVLNGGMSYLCHLFTQQPYKFSCSIVNMSPYKFLRQVSPLELFFHQGYVMRLRAFTAQTAQKRDSSGVYMSPHKSGTEQVKNLGHFLIRSKIKDAQFTSEDPV